MTGCRQEAPGQPGSREPRPVLGPVRRRREESLPAAQCPAVDYFRALSCIEAISHLKSRRLRNPKAASRPSPAIDCRAASTRRVGAVVLDSRRLWGPPRRFYKSAGSTRSHISAGPPSFVARRRNDIGSMGESCPSDATDCSSPSRAVSTAPPLIGHPPPTSLTA